MKKRFFTVLLVGLLLTGHNAFCQDQQEEQQGKEELNQQVFDLGDIVVKGMMGPETSTFFPGLVEVITEDEIQKSHAKNVIDIIGSRAGIWSLRNWAMFGTPHGQGAEGLNIRGQGSFDSVAIVVNGRQDNMMNLMGHPIVDSLVVDNIERVEVYKGPASVMFGSNARGGVINVITKKGGDSRFKIYQTFGSYDTSETVLSYGDSNGALDVYATTAARNTNGYLNDDPAVAGQDDGAYSSENNSLHMGYVLDQYKYLSLDWRFNWFDGWLPDSDDNPLKRNRWGMDLMYETSHPGFRNNFHVYHGQGAHRVFGDDGFDSKDVSDGVNWTHQMNTGKRNVLLLGGEYQRYGGRARNDTGFYASGAAGPGWHTRTLYSLFFADTHQFSDRWSGNAGLRAVHDFISGWNWVPQIGFEYNPTDRSALGISYSKAYYIPSLRESILFPRTFNEDLEPEFSEQVEINYTLFESMNWEWQSAVFYIRNWNRIERTNWYTGPPGWPPLAFENYPGDEKIKGFETSWTRYWPDKATLNLSYTFLDFDNNELDRTLAGPFTQPDADHKEMAPEHQVDLNLDYYKEKLDVTINAVYASGVYSGGAGGLPGANTTKERDDYMLVNVHCNYPVWGDSTIFVSVHNVFDRQYSLQDFTTQGGSEWTMPGITVTGGFDWVW